MRVVKRIKKTKIKATMPRVSYDYSLNVLSKLSITMIIIYITMKEPS